MSKQPKSHAGHGVMNRRSLILGTGGSITAAAMLPFIASPASAQPRTAYDLIGSARAASIFAEVIKSHGLEDQFRAQGNFGFFIPVNAAIERAPALQVERFRRDKDYAQQVILNHITDYGQMIDVFSGGSEGNQMSQRVKTRAGYTLTLVTETGAPRIGGHPIIYTNIRASNGYCHAIDGILQV
jgi:uncharacterized surface protein with fasciclin (FAS1) repeats